MIGQRYNRGTYRSTSFEVERSEIPVLLRRLTDGASIHITGGRKIGKTVLLRQLQRHLEAQDSATGNFLLPVYQDLQILSRPAAGHLFKRLNHKLLSYLGTFLSKRGLTTTFPAVPDSWDEEPAVHFCDYVNRVLDHLAAQYGNLRVVFLLDECETLLGAPDPHVLLGNLRALTGPETDGRVQLVVTGFRDLKEYQDPDTGTSPFTNVLDPFPLGLLGEEQLSELIKPVSEALGHGSDDKLRDQIISAAGGHPCIIQSLCSDLIDMDGKAAAPFEIACERTACRLSSQVFSSWLNQFRDEDHALFGSLLAAGEVPVSNTPTEEFLLYCGVALKTGERLSAPCGLFNTWYGDSKDAGPAPVGTSRLEIPAAVVQSFLDGKLVLFIGSGLSLGADVKGSFPTWTELPKRILAACEDYEVLAPRIIEAKRMIFEEALTLEQMLTELDALRTALGRQYQSTLNTLFRPPDASCGAAHRAVMALELQAVITTNYDHLLELADGPPNRERYTWRQAAKVLVDLQEGRKVLFKVHGTAEDHESVVMSYREYQAVQNDDSYIAVFRYLLQDRSLLFVGYGINDPLDLDLSLNANVQAFKESSRTHHILLRNGSVTDQERLLRDFNVRVIPYAEHEQVTEFLLDLASRENQG